MIATLQSLRFIFVMMIFMSHFSYRGIQAFDAGGDCGVAFFFLLSGFVCSLGYGQKLRDGSFSFADFIKRRLRKLYPLHLLCLLAFLLISHSAIDFKVLLNALLLQSWVPNPDWYFSCNSVSWLVILMAYVVVYWLTPYEQVNAFLYVCPAVRFVDFYIGMLLCRIYETKSARWSNSWIELSLVLLLLVALAVYPYTDAKFRNAPLYWLVLMPLIVAFAQEKGWLSCILKAKPMSFLGTLSMPLFLIHQMLIGIVVHRIPEMPVVVTLAVCIFLALMISWGIQIIFSRLLRL